MHPVAHEGVAVSAFALGDLVLVVGKDEVGAAAMNVEFIAQMKLAHRRAFEMPPGPPEAPWAVPARRVRIGRFPQHEIRRILFVGRDLDPGAGDQFVAVAPRELAVIGHAGNVKEDMAVGGVGMACLDEPFD